MPIFEPPKPESENKPQLENPNIAPERIKNIKVDSKLLPRGGILAHISGSQWIVQRYYSQFLNKDSNTAPFSLDMPAVDQQYKRINNLELRVQQSLTSTFQDGENEFEVTGISQLYPGIIPNVNDLFVVDIGDGRAGYFQVNKAVPRMYLQATAYEIEYKLLGYLTPEIDRNLEEKTNVTVTYVRDQYLSGRDPMLIDSDFADYETMRQLLLKLPNEYHREFFNKEFQTYLVPGQSVSMYDPYCTNFFKRMVDAEHCPWIRKVNLLNVDQGNSQEIFTVFDAALESDETIIDRCQRYLAATNTHYFTTQGLFGSIRYSGIEYCIYPTFIPIEYYDGSTARPGDFTVKPGRNVQMNRKISLQEAFSTDDLDGLGIPTKLSLQWIRDDEESRPYIFSNSFYENTEHQSGVERMFREAVRGNFCNNHAIIKACKDRVLWRNTTRYYYIPILLYVLRVAMANLG